MACIDPFKFHRGQRCTKNLQLVTKSLIEKDPDKNLTVGDHLCQKCFLAINNGILYKSKTKKVGKMIPPNPLLSLKSEEVQYEVFYDESDVSDNEKSPKKSFQQNCSNNSGNDYESSEGSDNEGYSATDLVGSDSEWVGDNVTPKRKKAKLDGQKEFKPSSEYRKLIDTSKYDADIDAEIADIQAVLCEGNYIYSCSKCDYVANQKAFLKIHYYRHLGLKPYGCNVCDYKASDPEAIKKHNFTHSSVKSQEYQCTECSKTFMHRQSLNKHMDQHHHKECPRSGRVYKCDDCNFVATKQSGLLYHRKSEHNLSNPTCDFCKCSFNTLELLSIHNEKVHGMIHKCDICIESFTSVNHLNKHVMSHSKFYVDPGLRKMYCSVCNELFTDQLNVVAHENQVHGYKCNACEARFPTREECALHFRSHGHYPYKCNQCDYYSSKKDDLGRHKVYHELDTYYNCSECDSKYQDSKALELHMKNEHNSNLLNCEFCDMTFKLRKTQLRHIRLKHSSIPPVNSKNSCNICDKIFTFKGDLKAHIKLEHSKENINKPNNKTKATLKAEPKITKRKIKEKENQANVKSIKEELDKIFIKSENVKPNAGESRKSKRPSKKNGFYHDYISFDGDFTLPISPKKTQRNKKKELPSIQMSIPEETPNICHVCERNFTSHDEMMLHIKCLHGKKEYKKREKTEESNKDCNSDTNQDAWGFSIDIFQTSDEKEESVTIPSRTETNLHQENEDLCIEEYDTIEEDEDDLIL